VEARARTALGEEAYGRAWQQGRSLGLLQAVGYARDEDGDGTGEERAAA
jgi:hypothetical protein